MAKLIEAIEDNFDGELTLDNIYALTLVANDLSHSASVVRGIVTERIDTKELSSSFFADIDAKIREYENLSEHQISATLAPSTALRQFVQSWPEKIVLVSTNVMMWLNPMMRELNAEFGLLKGRSVEVVDLGRLATVKSATQLKRGKTLSDILPPSHFNTKSGSLVRLADMVGVSRGMFIKEPIYAKARAMMIAEAFRRFMEKELDQP